MTRSLARVLSCVARRPRVRWTVASVAAEAGVSAGSASQKMRELVELGVLVAPSTRGGGYEVDRYHPLVRQWKVLSAVFELQPVVEQIRAMARRIVLFGSAADGLDDERSDLDLYVETDRPERVRRVVERARLGRRVQLMAAGPEDVARLMRQPVWDAIDHGIVLYDETFSGEGPA